MSDPKFSVGEDVWVKNPNYPPFPTTIVHIRGTLGTCARDNHVLPGYRVDPDLYPHPDTDYWCECVLRKRPPPDAEFDRFMDRLNLDIPEKVDA